MAAIRVKLDEDVTPLLMAVFERHGYACSTVVRQGWASFKDDRVWANTQAEQEMLVTGDKEFGDIRKFPPGDHFGIVLLRPDHDNFAVQIDFCERLLAAYPLEQLVGCTAVVSDRSIRVRS